MSFQAGHDRSVEVLVEGMVALGLLEGDPKERIADESYKKFYMHRTGHWLGMDVHDVGRYRTGDEWRALEPGMVLTVEPGIYIPEDDPSVDERLRGIGVRIEDDVLVTEHGPVVLTEMCPKEISDVEATCREQSRFADLMPLIPR
jgi:Xaa-Pro aminopeptidase